MMNALLLQISNLGMTAEAGAHRVGLGKAGLRARMRAVTVHTIAGLRSGMWNLRALDQFLLIAVASNAERLGVGLSQNHFAVLGRRVAALAILAGERRVFELRYQLGSRRLVRVMALQTICRIERLVVVRLL